MGVRDVVSALYFNAARLDRSVALDTEDSVRLAGPRPASIALEDVR
jgi:hypothetical protein